MTALAFLLLAAASFLVAFGIACYRRGFLVGAERERSRVEAWGRTQHERTR